MKKAILVTFCTAMIVISASSQVTQINSNKSLQFTYPLSSSKSIFVSALDQHLWASDGTLAGTLQLSSALEYIGSVGGVYLNGKFIFSASTAATGAELYVTDGTPAGTVLVKDIYPGVTGSFPSYDGALLSGYVYFTAETAAEGRELWRTDGTAAGTTLVKDIVPGAVGSNYLEGYHLFSTGTYLLFMAATPTSGVELWRSDGTGAGTVLLKDINPGIDSSAVQMFSSFNSLVLFDANDGVHGNELWKTDGTAAGTVLLKDINVGSASSTTIDLFGFPIDIPQTFHIFNNRAYFNANDGASNGEVWVTDGTAANTTLLKDIVSSKTLSFIPVIDAVNYPGKFIFPVYNSTFNRSELWQSDGTPAGTVLFKSFSDVVDGGLPFIYVPYSGSYANGGTLTQQLYQGNKFFFAAGTVAEGNELWISDGSVANTHIVKDIYTGTPNGIESGNMSNQYTSTDFYFAANNGTNGNELWKSNGTLAGTVMVADINPGIDSASPDLTMFLVNGKILFGADNGDSPTSTIVTDLYAVDGTFTSLPVQLTGITVTAQSADAILEWRTTQELNSRDFTIQRSYDGTHFSDIGVQAALGNSDTMHRYYFTDRGVLNGQPGVVYYRLLCSDTDGKGLYSRIVSLQIKAGSWNVQLLENPVSGNLKAMVAGVSGEVQVCINDISGKIVYSKKLAVTNAVINIPSVNLPHGYYVLSVMKGTVKKTASFIK